MALWSNPLNPGEPKYTEAELGGCGEKTKKHLVSLAALERT